MLDFWILENMKIYVETMLEVGIELSWKFFVDLKFELVDFNVGNKEI